MDPQYKDHPSFSILQMLQFLAWPDSGLSTPALTQSNLPKPDFQMAEAV